MKRLIAVLVFILSLTFIVSAQTPAKPSELRVLFIGNSLTYANDLPAIVKAIAEHNKKKFTYKMIAFPNFSLEDHLNKGDAVKAIKENEWDFVVLQQGSSALPESRENLLEFTRRFAAEIKKTNAKPALFMVWTLENRKFDFDRVRESYSLAAKEAGGVFLPAGESWREAWKEKKELKLYSDGLHPTPFGSYLAAAVIYQRLFDETTFEIPSKIKTNSITLELSKEEKELLKNASMTANKNFRA